MQRWISFPSMLAGLLSGSCHKNAYSMRCFQHAFYVLHFFTFSVSLCFFMFCFIFFNKYFSGDNMDRLWICFRGI